MAAYSFLEGNNKQVDFGCSGFLKGNITEAIKRLCRELRPEKIILQLPPTGLDSKTQSSIQEGFGRNTAVALNLYGPPVVKNLVRARAAFGCRRREEARQFFGRIMGHDDLSKFTKREQMQLINTITLAFDTVKASAAS
jgi:hypothetical protein